MKYINIIDKLKLLFELISGNYLFIGILIISLILFIINKFKIINSKKTGLLITLTFILSFSIILFYSSNTLFKTFDNIANLIFKNIYFPSIYVYIGIILITNIILITSVLSKNISKIYKRINIGTSFVLNFLLLILLNTIGTKEIDILSLNSLYTNKYIVTLIELTTSTFIIWMMSLLLISIINSILIYMDNKEMKEKPVLQVNPSINRVELDIKEEELEPKTAPIPAINTPVLESIPLSTISNNNSNIKKLENILEVKEKNSYTFENTHKISTNNGYYLNDLVKKTNNNLEEVKNTNSINDLLNIKPIVPNTKVNSNIELETNKQYKYTKDEYKLFYRMLNTVKEYNNGNSIVTMDDALSVNLLNKFTIKEYNLYKKMLQDVR